MYRQLYHCGIEKAATTFFRQLFIKAIHRDDYQLIHYGHAKGVIDEPYSMETQTEYLFPFKKVFITNVSCDYRTFCRSNADHHHYHGFYMYRDPRELVMSSYWSWKVSHGGGHNNGKFLRAENLEDGIDWTINQLHNYYGSFAAMRSWKEECDDERIRLYKFEDFFASAEAQDEHLDNLFDFLHLARLTERMKTYFAFKNLSGGRDRMEEDNTNHYRAGGLTWQSQMTQRNLDNLYGKIGDTIEVLGYER